MKLLASVSHGRRAQFTEVGGYIPGFWGRLFGLPVIKAELVPTNAKDKNEVTTQCRIDFEDCPVVLNQDHYRSVAFGNVLYSGIIPLKHEYGNVYSCMVREVELIDVSEAEPERHYYGY